ncbi:MAG: nitrous oxide-stimulated promoter family protein [Muribaculaceae bacterium]
MHIDAEKRVVEQMIRLYCRKRQGNATLCPDCRQLLDYALGRLDRCSYGNDKPTCRKCPIHCYRTAMKSRIKTVMRWAGPRMILYHPLLAIKHLLHP